MSNYLVNKGYLHIAYLPADGSWLLKIMSRLHQSSSITLRDRIASWGDTPLREMGLALSTKLAMLSQIVNRVDYQLQRLAGYLEKDDQKINECLHKNASYVVPDNELPYEILVDIDSFLFESRSTYEIIGHFLSEFIKRILGLKVSESELKVMLASQGIDIRWIEELRKGRILFFHSTAPWIALEIKSINPPRFELLVLKRDVKDFTNTDDYFHFGQLREIYQGFGSSMGAMYQWVLDQIEGFETKEGT